ncbi:GntR family transcriptional regulator [Nitratireductor aquimarinus]|uniref:GntR family transcriptional regulator n=1 Tax=Alphaproteobacteria TaxID=28211 RepID=UPI0019D36DF5|nr:MULTISPECIES: GntR family transcriptional regulator [Alphaproteobacteria]MBN7758241.1 GntR family transcriptional regulator [Nitratireductor aquimarinus]MBY6001002.1 GntR family transcriptional regulator [Tritonibacter mobilis]MBY6023034.1 GntR family transcriptional regulator [Nitratireductor sp. DP7N14-4]
MREGDLSKTEGKKAATAKQAPGNRAAETAVAVSRPRPSLQGIGKMPARDRAYHELKFRILEGRLPPGTTLLETEVASLLSLSRTPVREALIRLEEEGLVDVRPRHGITVKALTVDEIEQIYQVFSALEVKAAQLTARRGISAEDHKRLDGILTQMERASQRGDIESWSELDDEFHSELVGLCGNPRLLSMLRQLWDMQYHARRAITKLRPLPLVSDREHRAILAAIAAGNAEEATRLHQAHRDRADQQLLSLLRQRGTTPTEL